MKEEISLDIEMSKEEMAKIKELLTSSPGLRHYAFQLKNGEYLDLVEYKDYEKLEEKNKSLQSQLKEKEEENEQLKADYGNLAQVERDFLKEIIKEARECIEKEFDEYSEFVFGIELKNKILEILSKGENK